MRLSEFHDSDYVFDRLIRLTRVFFSLFLVDFCSQFHHLLLDLLRINLRNLFRLFSIRLSSSNNLDHNFNKLTKVIFYIIVFIDFLILTLLNIKFIKNRVIFFYEFILILRST